MNRQSIDKIIIAFLCIYVKYLANTVFYQGLKLISVVKHPYFDKTFIFVR